MMGESLYQRLGGYYAIAAVADDLLPRLQSDAQLARLWQVQGDGGQPARPLLMELRLLIDFLCASSGGPMHYAGRDLRTSHQAMQLGENDWSAFMGHVNATLDASQIGQAEREELVALVQSMKPDIVKG